LKFVLTESGSGILLPIDFFSGMYVYYGRKAIPIPDIFIGSRNLLALYNRTIGSPGRRKIQLSAVLCMQETSNLISIDSA